MLIEGIDYRRSRGVDDNPLFRQYITLRHHSVTSARLGLRVDVDAGYTFDGPTGMPLVDPGDFRFMRASLFHDGLYSPEGKVRVQCDRPVTKAMADNLFDEIAKADGANWLPRILASAAIRLFGRHFWEDDNRYLAVG